MQCAWQTSAGIGRLTPLLLDAPIPSLIHICTQLLYLSVQELEACAGAMTEIKKRTMADATIARKFIAHPPNPLTPSPYRTFPKVGQAARLQYPWAQRTMLLEFVRRDANANSSTQRDVAFWHLADMSAAPSNVCFSNRPFR